MTFHGNHNDFHGIQSLNEVQRVRNQKKTVPSSPALETHLGYWLRLVSNHVSGNFARALQERSVSVAEWVALNQIQRWTDMTPAQLADAMGMTRGAISKVLDKLQEKKWIARATSEDDNRVQFLSLTQQGKRALPDLASIADDNDNHFFSALDASEQTTLRSLLSKLADVHRISNMPVD
jgi:DNA-binding MarR family transcriptional regulator